MQKMKGKLVNNTFLLNNTREIVQQQCQRDTLVKVQKTVKDQKSIQDLQVMLADFVVNENLHAWTYYYFIFKMVV